MGGLACTPRAVLLKPGLLYCLAGTAFRSNHWGSSCTRSSSGWQGVGCWLATLFIAQRSCPVCLISGWVMLRVSDRVAAGTCRVSVQGVEMLQVAA